jgi:hypothetical protein
LFLLDDLPRRLERRLVEARRSGGATGEGGWKVSCCCWAWGWEGEGEIEVEEGEAVKLSTARGEPKSRESRVGMEVVLIVGGGTARAGRAGGGGGASSSVRSTLGTDWEGASK